MHELVGALTNVGYIACWILVGPLFAVLLFHMGERRWGNGPTWAFLGFAFNVFAVLLYLMLAGYESSESSSAGAMDNRRVRAMVQAVKGGHGSQRQLVDNPELIVMPVAAERDHHLESMLLGHRRAEALAYARERFGVAYQTGDEKREVMYRGYLDTIQREDAERHRELAKIKSGRRA